MANNKLLAVCSIDNDMKVMAKGYSNGVWGMCLNDIDDWFEKHVHDNDTTGKNKGCAEHIHFIRDVGDEDKWESIDYGIMKCILKNGY